MTYNDDTPVSERKALMYQKIFPDHGTVKIAGRHVHSERALFLSFSASYIEFEFTGDELYADMLTDASSLPRLCAHVEIFVNGGRYYRLPLHEPEERYLIYKREFEPETVTIRIVRLSEANFGKVGISALYTAGSINKTAEKSLKLEFIGDSITCGYGVEGEVLRDLFSTSTENPTRAYAWKTAESLNADIQLVSWSGNGLISHYIPPEVDVPDELYPLMYDTYRLADYAGSGFTGISPEQEYDFSEYKPDAVVINLGTNDFSYTRGKEDRINAFKTAYKKLVSFVCEKHPLAHVVCTLGIMGQDLCPAIKECVEELSGQFRSAGKEDAASRLHFLKFDFHTEEDGIGADYHPSERTHGKASVLLTAELKKILSVR